MSDNVLQSFADRLSKGQDPADDAADGAENLGAFGWLRGVRDRSIMLELRKKDGSVVALGYAWLERVTYDPTDGINLYFTGQRVKITGRNLSAEVRPNVRMLDGILRHRVPWIREFSERDALAADRRSVVVEEIEIAG
jgi:hypothetical protein